MSSDRIAALEKRLAAGAPLVLDGGLATELERRGCDLNHPLWSARLLIESPETVAAVHRDYLEAGADIVTTASYQATFQGMERIGIDRRDSEDLIRLSVKLACDARDAVQPASLVAASLGPYGAFLANGTEYTGDYSLSVEELIGFHSERWAYLADTEADLLAWETIPSLREVEAIAHLMRASPGRRAWVSLQCRDERHLADGTTIAEAGRILDSVEEVMAIGVNCVAPRLVPGLLSELKAVTAKPLLAYPNSGERFDAETKQWHGTAEPGEFAGAAARWRDAGAAIVGGCCRTTPEHVRALAKPGSPKV